MVAGIRATDEERKRGLIDRVTAERVIVVTDEPVIVGVERDLGAVVAGRARCDRDLDRDVLRNTTGDARPAGEPLIYAIHVLVIHL